MTDIYVNTLDLMVCVYVDGLQLNLIEPPFMCLYAASQHHFAECVVVTVYLKSFYIR